ncbi:RNA polymerase sigma-70 factor (ECF subfamily) [Mumia flava]|uniref:RNA polymerase sigma-70 factor (ECF subfamily) n=1 Tax=Mumia flava TaxID=1348852 RepID=A0A0B2B770_9ACTN|nr:RNA polymerase sigma factor SigJ [Mumia flava]PJJ53977.1 RNA polymerase sigma-70 factor (ECF subfamily) [Mumia flava]
MTGGAERGDAGSGPDAASDDRSVLIGICYRLLGSLSDAEDAVQETYVRWYRLSDREREAIATPRAWLIRTAGRIGLDMLGSARARHERYVGEWLPEPVPAPGRWSTLPGTGEVDDPAERVSLDESVSMALLVVLETMTPAERVAFVLHDVFRYPFDEVATIVGRSPAACRQLAASARRRVGDARRVAVASAEHAAVVRSFAAAWRSGDLRALVDLLDPDATAITDGGGLVSAELEPIRGAEAIAAFFVGVLARRPDLAVREEEVNGEPGLVVSLGGETTAVMAFALGGSAVEHVWVVRNPDKLRAWRR